jgi:hypothetical protein
LTAIAAAAQICAKISTRSHTSSPPNLVAKSAWPKPRPPDQEEEKGKTGDLGCGEFIGKRCRHLRHRGHEHQVEKQLQLADAARDFFD